MPLQSDFPLVRYEDGVLTIVLTPPEPVGGKTIEFGISDRFGGDAFTLKYVASGLNNQSGINIINSGAGVMQVPIFGRTDMSGRDTKNYAWELRRTDSGYYTVYAQGYIVLGPSQGA